MQIPERDQSDPHADVQDDDDSRIGGCAWAAQHNGSSRTALASCDSRSRRQRVVGERKPQQSERSQTERNCLDCRAAQNIRLRKKSDGSESYLSGDGTVDVVTTYMDAVLPMSRAFTRMSKDFHNDYESFRTSDRWSQRLGRRGVGGLSQ